MVRFVALFLAVILGSVFFAGAFGMHGVSHTDGKEGCIAVQMGGESCPIEGTLVGNAVYHARALSNFSILIILSGLLALATLVLLRLPSPIRYLVMRPLELIALRTNRIVLCKTHNDRRAWLTVFEHSPTLL